MKKESEDGGKKKKYLRDPLSILSSRSSDTTMRFVSILFEAIDEPVNGLLVIIVFLAFNHDLDKIRVYIDS